MMMSQKDLDKLKYRILHLEDNLLRMEETLTKMCSYRGFLNKKIKKLKEQNKESQGLQEKLKNVSLGIKEVRGKRDNIWDKCSFFWDNAREKEKERFILAKRD